MQWAYATGSKIYKMSSYLILGPIVLMQDIS